MTSIHKAAALVAALLLAACAADDAKLAPGEKLKVTTAVMDGYQEYTHQAVTGAFAVSLDGRSYAYYWCPGIRCLGGASVFASHAIRMCEKNGANCILFARDSGIIVPYEVVP
jgi:hypothetical protein